MQESDSETSALKKLAGLFLSLAPIPLTSLLALVTGVDLIALLGVVTSLAIAHLFLKKQGKSWAQVGLSKKPNWLRTIIFAIAAAVCLLAITSAAGSFVNYLTGTKPDISQFDVLRGNIGALIAGLFIVWTTAAFGEEMLFRGFVLNELKDLISKWKAGEKAAWLLALVISSVLFGLAHAYQGLAGMILTGIAGLGFGTIYLVGKRNLWTPILAHGFYDTIAFYLVFANYDKLIVTIETFKAVNKTI